MTSRHLDRLLNRWLSFIRGHFVLAHTGVSIALLVISHIALFVLDLEPNLIQSIVTEAAIALTSVAAPLIVTFAALRREIFEIVKLMEKGPPAATGLLLEFIRAELVDLVTHVEDLSVEGIRLPAQIVPDWVARRCWATTDGAYIGTDSNLPSRYMVLYEKYLEAHRTYLVRTGRTDSVRVILADEKDLAADRARNPSSYKALAAWHERNKVKLLLLSPDQARAFAEKHQTHGVTDMAFWENELALLWKYENRPEEMVLLLGFVGERRYEMSREFLKDVVESARPFPVVDS